MKLSICIILLLVVLSLAEYPDLVGFPGTGAFQNYTVVKPNVYNNIDVIDARDYDTDEFIVEAGVSKECLVKLDNLAWLVQTNAFRSLCPSNAFGSLIVNFSDHTGSVKDSMGRSCGRILSINSGIKNNIDTTEHSEVDNMRRLGYHNPGNRNNASFWNPLTIITPGASCPMDASALRWSNARWHVSSLTIADLISLNFTQIAVEPEYLFERTGNMAPPHPGVIKYVNREANVARFGHQNIKTNPCPPGCFRNATLFCQDYQAYLLTPDKLIPDVNIYVVPEHFALVPNDSK